MTEDQFEAITEWQKQTFGESTAFSKLKHLEEEVKELFKALENHALNGNGVNEVGEEIADCLFLLYGAAYYAGFDYNAITKAIDDKFAKNKARIWGKPDKNGVVRHVPQHNDYKSIVCVKTNKYNEIVYIAVAFKTDKGYRAKFMNTEPKENYAWINLNNRKRVKVQNITDLEEITIEKGEPMSDEMMREVFKEVTYRK